MRLLLDTHVLLWALEDSKSLGPTARDRMHMAAAIYVSSVSIWEAHIKAELGKLTLPAGFLASVGSSGFSELTIGWEHAKGINEVTLPHRDPFDRLLVAQSMQEQLLLVTADEVLLKTYPTLCFDGRR